jgi:hypothetical protein
MQARSRANFCTNVFQMTAVDELGTAAGCSYEQVWLEPGDILCFYTHWVHKSPQPPAAGEPARVVILGDFGKDSGAPLFRAEALEGP